MAGMTHRLFDELRKLHAMKKLTDEQLKQIAADHLRKLVDTFRGPAPPDGDDLDPILAEVERTNTLTALKYDRDILADDFEAGNYLTAAEALPEILKEQGMSFDEVEKDSQWYAKLLHAIMQAKLKAFDLCEAKVRGQQVAPDDLEAGEAVIDGTKTTSQTYNRSQPSSKLISEVIPQFVEEMQVRWEPKTKGEVESSLILLTEFVGDVPIQSIDRAKVADYKTTLKKLPPN